MKLAGYHIAWLAFMGILLGVIGGWSGISFAKGLEPIAGIITSVYSSLVVLFPLLFLFATWASSTEGELQVKYSKTVNSIIYLLLGGSVGAALGSTLFMVVAINVAFIFGRQDQALLRPILMNQIGLIRFLSVVGLTTMSAIPLAIWGHHQATGPSSHEN